MKRINQYSKEELQEIANRVKSIAGMAREMDKQPWGGNYLSIKKYLVIHNINTQHWTNQCWNKNQRLKDWSQYNKASSIKPHLILERGNKCESCGLDKWIDKLIPLEIHHIDGNRTNNIPDNLKILCPNCHALTENWKGKNKK
jgi:hypothetical protein